MSELLCSSLNRSVLFDLYLSALVLQVEDYSKLSVWSIAEKFVLWAENVWKSRVRLEKDLGADHVGAEDVGVKEVAARTLSSGEKIAVSDAEGRAHEVAGRNCRAWRDADFL